MVHKAGWGVAAVLVFAWCYREHRGRVVEDNSVVKMKMVYASKLAHELKEFGQSLETRAVMASALANVYGRQLQEEDGCPCEVDCTADLEIKSISLVVEEKAEKIENAITNALKEIK